MSIFAFDDFILDEVREELWQHGVLITLERQSFDVLVFMLRRPGLLVTKAELVNKVWEGRALSANVVSVSIARLRKSLGGTSDQYIKSVYGRGYRFAAPVRTIEENPNVKGPVPRVVPARSVQDPLVGRAAAVARLRAALATAASGRGAFCALLGEAGIGKTRLAEELQHAASDAGFVVSWGRCHAFEDAPPLWPLIQAVKSCEQLLPRTLREMPLDASPATTSPDSPLGLAEVASPDAWHRAVKWIRAVLRRIEAQQPWLIVIDDVQWADKATLALLTHALNEVPDLRVLVVLTARESEVPADETKRSAIEFLLGHRDCDVIALPRLTEEDTQLYVTQRFGVHHEPLSAAVFAQAEGIPFFMVELLRPWRQGVQCPTVDELTVSGHALGIIRQRIRRLDSATGEMLKAAAVIGRQFDVGTLSVVTEQSLEGLSKLLNGALGAGILERVTGTEMSYVFTHDLIRRVLYEDQTGVERARLHRCVGDAIAARGGDISPPLSTIQIALHLLKGAAGDDLDRPIDAARRAAASAARVGAYADACDLLRRARELCSVHLDSAPRLRSLVLYELANCERAAGQPGSAEHFAEAVHLARVHGLSEVLFAAGTRMSGAPGTVAIEGAHAVLEQALALSPAADHGKRAILLSHLAWTSPHCRDSAQVESLLRDAEQHATKAGKSARRALLRARLYFAGGPGDQDQAQKITSELERLALGSGPLQRALLSLEPSLSRIMASMQNGEFQAARRSLDVYGAVTRELRNAELSWHHQRLTLVLSMKDGHVERAQQRCAALKAEAERLELQGTRAIAAMDWAELHHLTMDIRPLASQYAFLLGAAEEDDPIVQTAKLRALVRFGLVSEARAALALLPVERLRALPKSRDFLAHAANVAVAAVATQSTPHAEVLYDMLRPFGDFCVASFLLNCYGTVSHVLGTLAHALGRDTCAREHFLHAIARAEAMDLALPRLLSSVELGSILMSSAAHGERAQGRCMLEATRGTAGELGISAIRAQADSLLGC